MNGNTLVVSSLDVSGDRWTLVVQVETVLFRNEDLDITALPVISDTFDMCLKPILIFVFIALFIFWSQPVAADDELDDTNLPPPEETTSKTPVINHSNVNHRNKVNSLETRNIHRKKVRMKTKTKTKKPSRITIPIKNAVVQALAPVKDKNEPYAASLKPDHDDHLHNDQLHNEHHYEHHDQHDHDQHHHDHHDDHNYHEKEHHDKHDKEEIDFYEDDLDGWIPPPPPPPHDYVRKPDSTLTHLSQVKAPGGLSAMIGDDFHLFLVLLTIAGFFGLMLSMIMPFLFLLQSQPLGVTSPYPNYGQVQTSGLYGYGSINPGGYPTGYPYGRRKRDIARDSFWVLFLNSLDKYSQRLLTDENWRHKRRGSPKRT